jgi:predicted branched-subunit amino acid permease
MSDRKLEISLTSFGIEKYSLAEITFMLLDETWALAARHKGENDLSTTKITLLFTCVICTALGHV